MTAGRIPSPRSGRDSLIFANFARFERFASSRERHSLPGRGTWTRTLTTGLLHHLGPLVDEQLGVIGVVALRPQVGDGLGRVRQRKHPTAIRHDHPYPVRGVDLVA